MCLAGVCMLVGVCTRVGVCGVWVCAMRDSAYLCVFVRERETRRMYNSERERFGSYVYPPPYPTTYAHLHTEACPPLLLYTMHIQKRARHCCCTYVRTTDHLCCCTYVHTCPLLLLHIRTYGGTATSAAAAVTHNHTHFLSLYIQRHAHLCCRRRIPQPHSLSLSLSRSFSLTQ